MNIVDLIAHFADREDVPVDVEYDVVPVVNAEKGVELYFWQADMDVRIMRGNMSRWSYPDGAGGAKDVIDIHYSEHLTPQWARLVCCKELVHMCDPVDSRVMTAGGLDKLLEKIGLPPEMTGHDDGNGVWNDRNAIWYALAIMFPWSCRQLLMQPYRSGALSIDQIAEMVDLPVEYVAVVMDEMWAKIYHIISK